MQIARAMMTDPELLLLDEPAAGLDLGGREALVTTLGEVAADPLSPATVLVTHHVEEIPLGFPHALLLRRGRVHAAGAIGGVLTAEALSETFGLALSVDRRDGRYAATLDSYVLVHDRTRGSLERNERLIELNVPAAAWGELSQRGIPLQQGDDAAADLAATVHRLVQRSSVQHGGKPIKWLGDGVMFYFGDASEGVLAALEMVMDGDYGAVSPEQRRASEAFADFVAGGRS